MRSEVRPGYYEGVEPTSARPIPEQREAERFEVKARKYMLQTQVEVSTEATAIPTPSDITSELFEYDLSGLRVKAIGQATGGYLREVAENEAAFSYSLQDTVSLYILNRIASNETPVYTEDLEGMIKDSRGWIRVALLLRGGLLDLVGSEWRVTERGMRELNTILTYCKLQNR